MDWAELMIKEGNGGLYEVLERNNVIIVVLILYSNRLELLNFSTALIMSEGVVLQLLEFTSPIACPVSIKYFFVRHHRLCTAYMKKERYSKRLECDWGTGPH